jgi:site-specific recombinase XerD
MKQIIKEFLIAMRADGISMSTLAWYKSILMNFAGWLTSDDTTITAKTMRLYIIHIREHYDSYDTQHAHIRALHRFWRWVATEYSTQNPMRNIAFPAQPKQHSPKSADTGDIATLFEHLDDSPIGKRDGAMLAFLADTGARATGVVSLQMQDLDMEHRTAIVHEKGRKSRSVSFTEFTEQFLQEWMAIRSPAVKSVFYNMRTMKPLTRSGLEQMLKRLKRKAGVTGRVNPHSFRHAFARQYLLNGGDLASLSQILGHEDIETTRLYYAVFTTQELNTQQQKYSPMKQIMEQLDKGDH